MNDQEKSKQELLTELTKLKQQIVELEAAQEKHHNQVHFLQTLIDVIPAPIFYKDAKGVYLGCNTAFENFLGKKREEIVGKTVYDLSPPDLAEIYHQADMELLAKKETQVYEASVQYADKTRRNVIFHKAVFLNTTSEIGGLIGVILDITDRKKAEEELRQHQELLVEKVDIIEQQTEALMELSTPVIQIWEGVLIVPLIGTIDSRRAAQIMESVLEEITRTEAEQIIIDITGVPVVDTEVANHLLKTIQATRLLGAECMIVGISSQIAQTLVTLGVDLNEMTTYAKLEKGLLAALSQLRYIIHKE